MSQQLQVTQQPSSTLSDELTSKIVLSGDLAGLSDTERAQYYVAQCRHLGLNPLTRPFDLLKEKFKDKETGKTTEVVKLYPNANCAQQLNSIHKVSHKVEKVEKDVEMGVVMVTVTLTTPDGRTEQEMGIASIVNPYNPQELLGPEKYANAIMKATTKAKRRSTFAAFGLLGGAEIEDQVAAGMITTESTALITADAIAEAEVLADPQAEAKKMVSDLIAAGAPEVDLLQVKAILKKKGVAFNQDHSIDGLTQAVYESALSQIVDLQESKRNG